MDPFIYIVKSNGTQTEHSDQREAMTHYNAELANGNKAELLRYNIATGKVQRYQCNCAKCAPKKIQYMPRKAN